MIDTGGSVGQQRPHAPIKWSGSSGSSEIDPIRSIALSSTRPQSKQQALPSASGHCWLPDGRVPRTASSLSYTCVPSSDSTAAASRSHSRYAQSCPCRDGLSCEGKSAQCLSDQPCHDRLRGRRSRVSDSRAGPDGNQRSGAPPPPSPLLNAYSRYSHSPSSQAIHPLMVPDAPVIGQAAHKQHEHSSSRISDRCRCNPWDLSVRRGHYGAIISKLSLWPVRSPVETWTGCPSTT